jgi:hypothetical protein
VQDAFIATAVLALRDTNEVRGRTLILLGPTFDLPTELQQDVVVLDDPIPSDEALRSTIDKLLTANGVPTEGVLDGAVDATRGLSLFGCRQTTAMSTRKSGLNLDLLWQRKATQIEQTKGLRLQRTGPKLSDIGGNAAICEFGRRIMQGKDAPRAIFLQDEIDKYMAGSTGAQANSVDADYLGVGLREMEDKGYDGMILLSPPGCGKTLFAQALAVEFGVPLVHFDFGAMKGQFVGNSETNVRLAWKVAGGVANGKALIIATCNRLESLPPELRRRFTYGLHFFDLPDVGERASILNVQIAAHDLTEPVTTETLTLTEGWTGAEIRNLCRISSRLGVPLRDAAQYIVPVRKSDPEGIERLRRTAHGKFLSANRPGPYVHPDSAQMEAADGERRLRMS